MDDVIFTPVFAETQYQHHLCSECGYQLNLGQSIWGGISFPYGKEKLHYCPGCGGKVIRFSERAIYETPINYKPLKVFYEAYETYRRKCQWLYHGLLTDAERGQIKELLPFAKDGHGWVKIAYDSAMLGSQHKLSCQAIKKLANEFKGER